MSPPPSTQAVDNTERGPDRPVKPVDGAARGGATALAGVPPLAGLAAFAALADLLVQRILLPSLQPALSHTALIALARWGALATNLAAIAGIIALLGALHAFVGRDDIIHARRRMTIQFFAFIALSVSTAATLFPQQMNRPLVLFNVGAVNVLVVTSMMVALRFAGNRRTLTAILALAVTALAALTSQVLELFVPGVMSARALGAFQVLRGVGEAGHLAALMLTSALVLPSLGERRAGLAWSVGGSIAGIVAAILLLAHMRFPADFPVVLYHAQRLVLLIEHLPWLYALPIAIALGAAVAACVGSHVARHQAGIGLLLLVAAGHAPRAPGRLLMLALAAILLARSVVAHATPTSASPRHVPNE